MHAEALIIMLVLELQGDMDDIARFKCKEAARQVGGPVITEDTSLCFDALNGLPGPYIKWFLASVGLEGLNDMLAGFPTKTAQAITIMAYCSGPDAEPILFKGVVQGQIVRPRGPRHFGWDPIFQPDHPSGQTYAEMSMETKNLISHRSKALALLRQHLESMAH